MDTLRWEPVPGGVGAGRLGRRWLASLEAELGSTPTCTLGTCDLELPRSLSRAFISQMRAMTSQCSGLLGGSPEMTGGEP